MYKRQLLSTAATLGGSYLLRPVINAISSPDLSAGEKVAYLAMMIGILIAVYLVGVLGTYLQHRIMITVSQNSIEQIRNDLFNKLQSLPVRFYDNESNGEIMSRFTNDVDNIGTMLDTSITSFISGMLTIVGTLVMMLTLIHI